MNKIRFEAFSDAVFAFAITLLALGFALPEIRVVTNRELASELLGLWPNLIAYALSFFVIGLMWQNHHALFRYVHEIDRKTVFWNLLLLAATVLIPFATRTLGSYPTMPAAAFFYGLVLTASATCFNLMLTNLARSHAFSPEVGDDAIASAVRGYRLGWVVYAAVTLLAIVAPIISFALYILIVLYFFVPRRTRAENPITAREW
ncbi:MAG TPA: TMEM175 family protein [Candidatus Cybelea sp.]|nr:TMEM175 family protein [Candidatus Cybelea sp.]